MSCDAVSLRRVRACRSALTHRSARAQGQLDGVALLAGRPRDHELRCGVATACESVSKRADASISARTHGGDAQLDRQRRPRRGRAPGCRTGQVVPAASAGCCSASRGRTRRRRPAGSATAATAGPRTGVPNGSGGAGGLSGPTSSSAGSRDVRLDTDSSVAVRDTVVGQQRISSERRSRCAFNVEQRWFARRAARHRQLSSGARYRRWSAAHQQCTSQGWRRPAGLASGDHRRGRGTWQPGWPALGGERSGFRHATSQGWRRPAGLASGDHRRGRGTWQPGWPALGGDASRPALVRPALGGTVGPSPSASTPAPRHGAACRRDGRSDPLPGRRWYAPRLAGPWDRPHPRRRRHPGMARLAAPGPWRASTPVSITATVTPAPVANLLGIGHAQIRVAPRRIAGTVASVDTGVDHRHRHPGPGRELAGHRPRPDTTLGSGPQAISSLSDGGDPTWFNRGWVARPTTVGTPG